MSDLKIITPGELVPALNPLLVKDGAGLDRVADFFKRSSVFGLDYETNIVESFYDRRARTLQVGDRNEQYIIDLMEFCGGRDNLIAAQGHFRTMSPYGEVEPRFRTMLQPVVDAVRPVFESKSHLKVIHNANFEYVVSKWCLGMRPWNLYDTYLVEQLIYCGIVPFDIAGFWALDDLIARYCNVKIDKELQKQDWLKEEPLTEQDLLYCALDCRLLFPIKNGQYKELTKGNLFRVAQIENDAVPFFGDFEINGFFNDPDSWRDIIKDNDKSLDETVAKLDEFFLPLVGEKPTQVDAEELHRREVAWRSLGDKSAEEKEIGLALRKCKDPVEKESLRLRRDALEASRKAAAVEAKAIWQAASSTHTKKWAEADEKMEGRAAINYNAPQQLQKVMLEGHFGFTAKNLPNTNDKTLEKHAAKPVVIAIRDYRTYSKRRGTYGERWIQTRAWTNENGKAGFVHPSTGRIHARFRQIGAETGRASCTNPNLFNLPKKDIYRAAFKSRTGYNMCTRDASGQELCILADYSQEPLWIQFFNNDQDLHCYSARFFEPRKWEENACKGGELIFSKKLGKEVTAEPCCFGATLKKCKCPKHLEQRDDAKPVNFGVPYGKSAYSLAADLKITPEEAEVILQKHRAQFPKVWEWLDANGEAAMARLEARSKSGRRRLFRKVQWEQAKKSAFEKDWIRDKMKKDGRVEPTHEEIMKVYKGIQAGLRREANNMPIQGTGADQMKLAMGCGFDENGNPYGWHLLEPKYGGLHVNFVYDEHVAEIPHDQNVWITPFLEGAIDTTPVEHQGKTVAKNVADAFDMIGDCISRAGGEFIKSVPMKSEGAIDTRWKK